jgi:hypothetical protein
VVQQLLLTPALATCVLGARVLLLLLLLLLLLPAALELRSRRATALLLLH